MQAAWETLIAFAATSGLKLVYAAAVLFIGLKVIGFLIRRTTGSKGFRKIEPGVQSFIKSFASIGLKALLLVSVIGILGVPLTSVVTLLASAGLAIGLALQGALSNLAGGMMILIFKPFKAGDYVEANTVSGTVREITIFYTTLITIDNKRISVPNGTLTNSAITNYSSEPRRRLDMNFSVSYKADIGQVKESLLRLAKEHPLALQEPEPFAALVSQGSSALQFVLRVWCLGADYWTMLFDLNESVKREFDSRGIEIPYQQMDVHIKDSARQN